MVFFFLGVSIEGYGFHVMMWGLASNENPKLLIAFGTWENERENGLRIFRLGLFCYLVLIGKEYYLLYAISWLRYYMPI